MITHTDEILQSAVSTDTTAVPRYNLVRPDGTVVERNVALKLANAIAREGTPVNKPLLDEFLAASGVTAGSATAYTLAQEGYELFDGAPVRFQLHTASSDGATLNINGTGAKPVVDMMGEAMAGGIPAGTWLTAMYSAAAGAYVLAGGEAVQALYGERYAVDDAVAYVKDVPGDALPYAEVGEVGGMTYKVNVGTEEAPVYELRSAAVSEVESVGVNLFDKSKVSTGYYVRGDNGKLGSFAETCASNYIEVDSTKEYLYIQTQDSYQWGAFFDADKNYVANASVSVYGNVISIPTNAKYLRYTVMNANLDSFQIVYGSSALPYTPYVRNTLPIPEAVRALDGYGWGVNDEVYNYIDWKKKQFVKRVGKKVLDGTESWTMTSSTDAEPNVCFFMTLKSARSAKAFCSHFEHSDYPYIKPAGTTGIFGWESTFNYVYFAADYTTVGEWKVYLAEQYANGTPVTVYYELATPIITDITDILPADNLLPVEAGGTITAVNAHGYAVPTTITYQRNVLANRASTYAIKKLRLALELLASIDYVDEAIKPLATSEAVTAAIAAAIKGLATTNDVSNAVKGLATTGNVTDAINTHKAESAAHDAASIVTDTTRQFVSAAEKAAWNEGTGGNAKVLSNTRITTDSTSITIDLPTGYNYFRIVLSEVATTDTSLGTVRCSLNASALTSSGLQLGAGDSEGDAFVMSSELNDYVFSMLLYDDGTFGSVVMDIVRFSSTTQGTCRWATDGNGSDAAVSMAMYSFSASGGVTSMTISTLSGFYLRHGMGITVIGVK